MSRYLIVFYKNKVIHATEVDSDVISFWFICDLLLHCKTPGKIKKMFGDGTIVFNDMTEMNDYFNEHPELTYLIVFRENKRWYFRRQGEYVFQPIEMIEAIDESVEEVKEAPAEDLIEMTSPDDAIAVTSVEGEIEERIAELETQIIQLRASYQQSQKYETYIFIGLLILIAVVGIIALFY